jgi:hypothetical protein
MFNKRQYGMLFCIDAFRMAEIFRIHADILG